MRNTWPFPAVADPMRAYIDLSGLVGLLWRRDRSQMQVCEFCRTANALGARCAVCGTGQTPHPISSQEIPDRSERGLEPVPLRTIGLVAGRTLILPLLLFTAFFMWYGIHQQVQTHNAQEVQPKPQTTVASDPLKVEVDSYATLAQPPLVKASTSTTAPPRTVRFWSTSTIPHRPVGTHRISSGTAALNSCADRNILMRAVCVNNVCAGPGQAQRTQCAEAVAQRRIDEDRRNPSLVN